MNDLEAKLRSLSFRELPPGWRGSMVSATVVESDWRKWLAPHPAAWAALAAIWIVLALVSRTVEKPSSSGSSLVTSQDVDPLSQPALFAFQFRAITGMEPPL